MADLFLKNQLNSDAVQRAWSVSVGVKRPLLCAVFGRDQVELMDRDAENDRPAYLNRYGANVHLVCVGGNHDDPIYSMNIAGHHPGEAAKTVTEISKKAESVYCAV